MAFRIEQIKTNRPIEMRRGWYAVGSSIVQTGPEEFTISGTLAGKGGIRALMRAVERAKGRPVDIKITLAKAPKKRRRERSKGR